MDSKVKTFLEDLKQDIMDIALEDRTVLESNTLKKIEDLLKNKTAPSTNGKKLWLVTVKKPLYGEAIHEMTVAASSIKEAKEKAIDRAKDISDQSVLSLWQLSQLKVKHHTILVSIEDGE